MNARRKRVLVMGGTRFSGKRLVHHLLLDGHDVTVATRGNVRDTFHDEVRRIHFDRTHRASMESAFKDQPFDIVFDQIGYSAEDMASACQVFAEHIGLYVFTSSSNVYFGAPKLGVVESDFDPMQDPTPVQGSPGETTYDVGKRLAESYLAHHAPFPFTTVRLPIVLGPGEPKKRIELLVGRILDRKPIWIPPGCGKMSYVDWDDAGRFPAWLGTTGRTGIYNAGSERGIDPAELTRVAGRILGVEPILVDHGEYEQKPTFVRPFALTMDVSKARKEGFVFTPFDQWFPSLVRDTAEVLR